MEGKKWWRSRTLWVNVVAALVLILHNQLGFDISTDEQAIIIGFLNLLMRAITKQPLE